MNALQLGRGESGFKEFGDIFHGRCGAMQGSQGIKCVAHSMEKDLFECKRHRIKKMKIAHIADIHVRDARRDEYAAVFDSLLGQLRAARPDIVAIAGDVFDTMTRASPANWDDVAKLLSGLSKVAPVVLIPGNHDLNERKRTARTSLLEPLFSSGGGARDLDPARICMWAQPGTYVHPQLPDLQWVVGVPGEPLPTAEDLAGALAANPNATAVAALFHETISGCRYPNGQAAETDRMTAAYAATLAATTGQRPLAVLLGDVHLRQEVQIPAANARCAYPGSLVCQNFGEPHNGHGWLEWEFKKGDTRFELRAVEVPNPSAMYTANVVGGQDATEEPRPEEPAKWRVVADAATTPEQLEVIIRALKARHGRPPREVIHHKPGRVAAEVGAATSQDGPEPVDLGTSESEYLAEWLRESEGPELAAEVMAAHAVACQRHQQPAAARPRIKRLEFSNLYCYGEGNTADFEAMATGPPGIVGLTAPNMSGKSALLDIIYMAMTGATMRGRKSRILHQGASHYELVLDFELDGRPGRVTSWRKSNRLALTLEYDGEDLTGKTVTETSQSMRAYFGDPKHMARISLYRPGSDHDFMHLDASEQDALLMELLALGHHKLIKKGLDKRFTELRAEIRTTCKLLEQALPGVVDAADTQAAQVEALLVRIEAAESHAEAVKERGLGVRAKHDETEAELAALTAARNEHARVAAQLGGHMGAFSETETVEGEEAENELTESEVATLLQEFVGLHHTLGRIAEPAPSGGEAAGITLEEAETELERAEADARALDVQLMALRERAAGEDIEAVHSTDTDIITELEKIAASAEGTPSAAVRSRLSALRAAAEVDVDGAKKRLATATARADEAASAYHRASAVSAQFDPLKGAEDLLKMVPAAMNIAVQPSQIDLESAVRRLAAESLDELADAAAGTTVTEEEAATAAQLAKSLRDAAHDVKSKFETAVAACPDFDPASPPTVKGSKPTRTAGELRSALPPVEERRALAKITQPAEAAEELERKYESQEKRRAAECLGGEIEALTERGCAGCGKVKSYLDSARAATHGAGVITLASIKAAREQEHAWARRGEMVDTLRQLAAAQEHEALERWEEAKRVHDEMAEAADEAARAEAKATQLSTKRDLQLRAGTAGVELGAIKHYVEQRGAAQESLAEKASALGEAKAALEAAKEQYEEACEAERAEQLRATLEMALKAEQAREKLERYKLADECADLKDKAAIAATRLAEAKKQHARSLAASECADYHSMHARRGELAARLKRVGATAAAALEETAARHAELQEDLAKQKARLEKLRATWQVVAQALPYVHAKDQVRAAQKELKVVALHRSALDPAKGIAPRVLSRTRAEFISAVNRRLASATAPFRVVHTAEGYELESAPGVTTPICRDPALTSGYQGFVLELAARAALEEAARVPLPAMLFVDEGFGCLDGENLPAVAESLRCVAADARPGRPAPLVLAVTHREDLRAAFAQHYTLDYAPGRETRLRWGGAPRFLQMEAARAAGGAECVRGRCDACDCPVAPGQANWDAHCDTPGHAAWTDPGLVGARRDEYVSCALCICKIKNGDRNWARHVKSKRHQAALANRDAAQ